MYESCDENDLHAIESMNNLLNIECVKNNINFTMINDLQKRTAG